MAVVPIIFWLFICKKFDAVSPQTADKIVFRDDNETVKKVGDWCDAGLVDFRYIFCKIYLKYYDYFIISKFIIFRPPKKTDTQCLKLHQCMNLVKRSKERYQKTFFCDFNNVIFNESLVCCTIDDFERSREELRRTSTSGNKMDRGSYFSLENCLSRDREFRYYRDAGYELKKSSMPHNKPIIFRFSSIEANRTWICCRLQKISTHCNFDIFIYTL